MQRIAERVERRGPLKRLLDAMETRRMSAKEKLRLLERIVNDCMAGVITPAEANRMTKTVNECETRRKRELAAVGAEGY